MKQYIVNEHIRSASACYFLHVVTTFIPIISELDEKYDEK